MVAKAFTSSVSTIVKCHSSSGISLTAASFSPTRWTYSCSSMSLCTPICWVKATCICLAVRTSLLSFCGFLVLGAERGAARGEAEGEAGGEAGELAGQWTHGGLRSRPQGYRSRIRRGGRPES